MGNTLYTAATSTAADREDGNPIPLSVPAPSASPTPCPAAADEQETDSRAEPPILETTDSQNSADLAHPAEAAEAATEPQGTPTPPTDPTPDAYAAPITAPDAETTTGNAPVPTQSDHVSALTTLANQHANDQQLCTVIAAGIQGIEQTDNAQIQRIVFNDATTAVQALVDAGPRADLADQGNKVTRSSDRRPGNRAARGAFQNRTTAASAHTAGAATTSSDVWSTISADNTRNAQARSTRSAPRGRGAFGPTTLTRDATGRLVKISEASRSFAEDTDPWSAPDSEPWGTATTSATSAAAAPTTTVSTAAQDQNGPAAPAHPAGAAELIRAELAAQANSARAAAPPRTHAARPTAQTFSVNLIPTKPIYDPNSLPAYPSMETIKREVLQFFSAEAKADDQDLERIDHETLASIPLREPQDVGFAASYRYRQDGTTPFDPVKLCHGEGENRSCFHQSIRVHRLLIKTTWEKFRQVAERQDLLFYLEKISNLRVLSFGHMILLEFAMRRKGDHDRMGTILRFIHDMLRCTDFERDIPMLIQRHHAAMTRGVDPKDAFSTEQDLRMATYRWVSYCHGAFVYLLAHLSGTIVWNVEWLQSKELDGPFRRAIHDNILMKAHPIFEDLRRFVYQQYVLRHIHALETGDTNYGWMRLLEAPKFKDDGERFTITSTTIGETVIFMAAEIFNSAFIKTMVKDGVLLNMIPSSNRADVLYSVRKFFPGPMTKRVIFWFGQSYINNGNDDYGRLIAELCYHYTTYFGRISQYVVLPAYDRTHRAVWTSEVLCLFLQRGLIVPHARVALHPYDLQLWKADQPAAERGDEPPRWTNRNQTAEGHIYKFGAVEARKHNLHRYHDLNLWTWYQADHPGEFPPPELYEHCRPSAPLHGRALAAQFATKEKQTPAPAAVAHSAAAAAPSTGPSQVPAPPTAATPSASQAVSPVPPSTAPAVTSQLATPDLAVELITRVLGGPVLQSLVDTAAQQAVRQVSSEIDNKLERIEALLRSRFDQPTTTAEHRPQDSGSDA